MSKPLRKTFFQRLNLLTICSALLLGLVLVRSERLILRADLEHKGEAIGRILASVTLDAVMVHDYATVERYVHDIVTDPAILFIKVERNDRDILASAGNLNPGRPVVLVSQPVTLGDDRFGMIHIGLSTARIDSISRNLLLATLAAMAIFHTLGIVMSTLALKKAVLAPLRTLNHAIEKLRQGKFREQITIGEPAEFSAIASSFNSMAWTIRKNFDNIHSQQELLELEQAKLSAIVNSMADGLFVTDNTGKITAFNRSATVISGYSEKEAIGIKCTDLFQTTLCKDACALNHGGATVRNKETTLKSKDGKIIDVSVSSAMLFDTEGEPAGGVQTFRDITLEKKRQEMLCHTEKLAAIGQLAAGVAHEINNPLSNIMGYARMIKPGSSPEQIASRIEVIIEQSKKCSSIVKGLLDFSRSSKAAPRVFPLAPVISKAMDMVSFQAEKQHTRIQFTASEELSVFADAGKIEQVVFNLLLNALQTEPKATEVCIDMGRSGDKIFFSVTDNGPGAPADVRQKMFDPFFTTKPVGEGTGLGLAICAGIIAEAGGSLELETATAEGGGLAFTAYLPEAARRNIS